MSDLERELEQELHRVLDPIAGLPIPPRRMIRNRRVTRALLGGAGAALSFKLLTGVAVAAAAVTVAGAATTGSLDPNVWGQQVKTRVAECKDKLADGQHGSGNQNAHGNGNANGHDKDKNHQTPKGQTGSLPTLEPEPVDEAGTHRPVNIK